MGKPSSTRGKERCKTKMVFLPKVHVAIRTLAPGQPDRLTFLNPERKPFGFSAAKFKRGNPFYEALVHPLDRLRFRVPRLPSGRRRTVVLSYRVRYADGGYRAIHELIRCLPEVAGTQTEQIVCLVESGSKTLSKTSRNLAAQEMDLAVAAQERAATSAAAGSPFQISLERLHYALAGSNDGVWDWDFSTDAVYYSPRWKAILGYADEEVENHLDSWKRLVDPSDRERVLAEVAKCAAGQGESFETEFRMRHKTGGWVHVLSRGILLRDARSRPCRLVGTSVDITARKRAAEERRQARDRLEERVRERTAELQAARARLEVLFHTAPAGIVIHGPEGRIRLCNPAARLMLGLAEGEADGKPPEDFSPRILREDGTVMPVNEFPVAQVLAHRQRVTGQIVGFQSGRAEGPLWAYVNAEPCLDAAGQVVEVVVSFMDLTARKRAEAALSESAEFKQSLISSMQEGFSVLDTQGVALDVNPALCQMTGFSRAELVGVGPPHPYWPPEEYDRIQAALGQTLNGDITDFELVFMRRNGERFPVIVSPFVVQNRAGETISYSATVKDITEAKRMEALLRHSEERLRLALRASNAGVWAWDPLTGAVHWDASMSQLYGCGPNEQPSFDLWIGCMHPDDRPAMLKRVEEFLQPDSPNYWDTEFRVLHPTLGERWIHGLARAERDGQGRVVSLVGINLDVTDRQRATEALRLSEERLRLTLQGVKQGLYDLNVQTGDCVVSPEYALMLGYEPAEFQETNAAWIERLHPEDRAAVALNYHEYVAGLRLEYRVEFRQRTKQGDWKWILSLGKIVAYSADGQPLRMLGTHTDLTAEKQAELALRELNATLEQRVDRRTESLRLSEERFRHLADASFEGVVLSHQGRIVDCNEQLLKILRYRREQVIGRALEDFITPQWRELVQQRIQQGLETLLELELICGDGSACMTEVHGHSPAGPEGLRVSVLRDITERKALERIQAELETQRRDLVRFQRLAELTEVSASVMHQIGQPFTAIINNVSAAKTLVSRCTNPHCQAGTTLMDTDASLKLVQSTMQRLQALTHPERARREPKDLNALVGEVVRLIQPEADAHQVELRTRLASGLPLAALDEVQISQALLNLLRNACEAVASCEAARRIVTVKTSAGENGTLILEVSDLGVGIAPAILPHLFEPFFTTKPKGTGVGLRLGRTIVTAHGGRLDGRNNDPGPGATFQIVLPTAVGGGL